MYPQGYQPGLQLMHQPINPNQAPIPQIQLAPNLQQYLPAMVANLVNFIQGTANTSPLRVIFYNKVAEAQYQNGFFAELVQSAMRVLEQKLIVLSSQMQPMEIVQGVADAFLNYRVARQIREDQTLYGMLPPQLTQAAETVVGQFESDMHETQMVAMRMQGQAGQPTYGAQTTGWQPSWQTGGNGGGYQRAANTHPAFADTQDNYQRPPPGRSWQPSWQREQGAERIVPAREPERRESFVREVRQDQLKLTKPPVDFVRSEKKPYDHAYDQNEYRMSYSNKDGYVRPVAHRKDPMDKDTHLGRPLFAKAWTPDVTAAQQRERLLEAKRANADKPIETHVAEENVITSNIDDGFVGAESLVRQSKKNTRQIHAGLQNVVLLAQRRVGFDPTELLRSILASESPKEAGDLLKQARLDHSFVVEETAFVEELNDRLTQRVNRFVTQECGLPDCTITDYAGDGHDLADALEEAYGLGQTYLQAHGTIVSDAADFVTAEQIGQDPHAAEGEYEIFYVQSAICSYVDQTSVEISMTIPERADTVVLTPEAAGHASQIVTAVTNSGERLAPNKRFYLRTSDGVKFEILKSPIIKDSILIRLVK